MADKKSRFGFEPVDIEAEATPVRRRGDGPMSAAVRDAASSLQDATEAKVEARRKNAADAKTYREAAEDGRVLERISLNDIHTDDLPRDRLMLDEVARSDEMEELKTSIRENGQQEPIEVFLDEKDQLQLKKGWRRLTALRQLFEETRSDAFSTALARIDRTPSDRIHRYVDMVEENVIREDLSFAEMAQVAISVAADPGVEGDDPEKHVITLYRSLNKMKRSYIRSFVGLLVQIGDTLPFPKSLARDAGVEAARRLKNDPASKDQLLGLLRCVSTPEEQARAIGLFNADDVNGDPVAGQGADVRDRRKFEFLVGHVKVTARKGELRFKGDVDYTSVSRDRLEAAIQAFEDELTRSG